MTQCAKLIHAIRRSGAKGMTYGDLEAMRVSTCPWKRLSEAGHLHLKEGERLSRFIGKDKLIRFRIAKVVPMAVAPDENSVAA